MQFVKLIMYLLITFNQELNKNETLRFGMSLNYKKKKIIT